MGDKTGFLRHRQVLQARYINRGGDPHAHRLCMQWQAPSMAQAVGTAAGIVSCHAYTTPSRQATRVQLGTTPRTSGSVQRYLLCLVLGSCLLQCNPRPCRQHTERCRDTHVCCWTSRFEWHVTSSAIQSCSTSTLHLHNTTERRQRTASAWRAPTSP